MKRQFRLGSTSYVYPADILPNVRKLAPLVDDVEIVLFEVDGHGTNLPGPAVVAELKTLARDNDLTYTIHLPIDLDWRDGGTIDKILRALDATRALDPLAHVLHLDGRLLQADPTRIVIDQWQEEAGHAIDRILTHVDARLLCIENLEAWPPGYFAGLVRSKNLTRCVDVGHFWLCNSDPLPHLQEHISRTRVVHMHGIHTRDHQSLVHQARDQVTQVLDFLARSKFAGVLTLEVFSLDDFLSSRQVIRQWEDDLP